ncbi:MAG: ComF family protein [Proteobacteria bacterium]|nr:ComF family protein [Pseudomonadota bacterium]
MRFGLQTALAAVFPPRCVACGAMVDSDFALCGAFWGKMPFISGLTCDACGVPLPGAGDGCRAECDDCLTTKRPWAAGRSALLYRDMARKLVLGLKHGKRTEIARPAAIWMARAGQDILQPDMIVAPVPLHWSRLVRRSFNQSAVLADRLARQKGLLHLPDLLRRTRATRPLDHRSVAARFAELDRSIEVHPRHVDRVRGRPVLLVDDVMTAGATLAEATRACHAAGAGPVFVLTLARVAKET